MLIMPANAKNFQQMAATIANDFFTRGTTLEDGIVKAAEQFEMTPEEVKRLVEKTNTAASIQLLRSAENKKDSFDLAKFASVIRRTHSTAPEASAEQERAYSGIPNTRDVLPKPVEKTAAEVPVSSEASFSAASLFALRQHIGAMQQEKVAAELAVRDGIDWLLSEFSALNGPDFAKFASEASALYGTAASVVLPGMASYLNAPEGVEKLAEGAFVDDTTPVMRRMASVCEGLAKLASIETNVSEAAMAERWLTKKLYNR